MAVASESKYQYYDYRLQFEKFYYNMIEIGKSNQRKKIL